MSRRPEAATSPVNLSASTTARSSGLTHSRSARTEARAAIRPADGVWWKTKSPRKRQPCKPFVCEPARSNSCADENDEGADMVGTELLETGQLSIAIERVAGEVKTRPTDLAARTCYFELLCLNGDLERAGKQLEVLAASNVEMTGGASVYHGAIQAEKERRQFFHGGPRPRVLDDPPYANAQLEAVEY